MSCRVASERQRDREAMTRGQDDDDIRQWIHAQSMLQRKRMDALIRAMGRDDLADELKARSRDIDLGLGAARATWHSISDAQRRVLLLMFEGRALVRVKGSRSRYDAKGSAPTASSACSIATARNLCSRDLIHCDGTAFDPEARFVMTERGRFVTRRGPSDASMTAASK